MNVASKPTNNNGQNRRAFQRRNGLGTVVCRPGKLGLGRPLKGTLLDLSQDGLRVMVKSHLPPKTTEIEIEFEGVGSTRSFTMMADVRSTIEHADDQIELRCQFQKRLPYPQFCQMCKI